MDCCFLCLENNKNTVDCIQVNSDKWKEQNMKELIEKHLWPMECLSLSCWICFSCWEELHDFHKFYERIEETHKKFCNLVKVEDTQCLYQDFLDGGNNENQKDLIPMEQTMHTGCEIDELFIKAEENNFFIEEISFKQDRKRGRPRKYVSSEVMKRKVDPLKRCKRVKQNRIFKKTRKSTSNVAKYESDATENANDSQMLSDTNYDNDTETDSEHQNYKPPQLMKVNKKNHRMPDKKTLKEYDKIIADNFKIFCSICQIPLDNFIALRKHFEVEHKQRGYARCCDRNFFTRSVLVDHIHFHLNPEHFKCDQCGKVFSDRSRLVSHKRLHDDSSKLEKCNICNKLFADKGPLKRHILTHSSEKKFLCTICEKYFSSSFLLNHHIEAIHQNKYLQICDVCGKSIRCPTAFSNHMEQHESKPISCDVCGLLLSNREGLKRHKNSQHPEGGRKDYTCHICLKISPTERALKAHIRSVHESGFDYKCDSCEKSFRRPAALKEHKATHTGTPLYTCSWCPRTFISSGNMYSHRKSAHPKEWEEMKRQKYVESIT